MVLVTCGAVDVVVVWAAINVEIGIVGGMVVIFSEVD
jgi:hypothetical protein